MHKSRPSLTKRLRETALKQKHQDKAERRKLRRDNANQATGTEEQSESEGGTSADATAAVGETV